VTASRSTALRLAALSIVVLWSVIFAALLAVAAR
jgi:hypothetical protein